MSGQDTFPMTPLDQMVSSESLQILKAAVPYAPPSARKLLSVFAKFQEFKTALSLFPDSGSLSAMSVETPEVSSFEMLEEIRRFAMGRSKENIESLISALSTLQIFQAMQQEESESIKKDPEECSGREEG